MVTKDGRGLPASVVLHAGALTLVLLLPVLGRPPLPEPRVAGTVIDVLPVMLTARVPPPAPAPGGGRLRVRRVAPSFVVPRAEPETVASSEPVPGGENDAPCSGCVSGPEPGPGLPGDGPTGGNLPGTGLAGDLAIAPVRVGSGVEAPRKLVHVAPRYPELAQRTGVQGRVDLECVIDPRGQVANVQVKDGPALLQEAAVAAVRQWRYTPTRLNGVPVAVVMTVTVQFTLRRESI